MSLFELPRRRECCVHDAQRMQRARAPMVQSQHAPISDLLLDDKLELIEINRLRPILVGDRNQRLTVPR